MARADTFMIVGRSPIAGGDLDWVYDYPRARPLSHYPNAIYFNAFDLAVSAAGYNTFHELMHFGLPALLIPRQVGIDDQVGRARAAERAGAAEMVTEIPEIAEAIHRMLDDPGLPQRRARALAMAPVNGADEIARHLAEAPATTKAVVSGDCIR
jgi:predicted glycosyltransferase